MIRRLLVPVPERAFEAGSDAWPIGENGARAIVTAAAPHIQEALVAEMACGGRVRVGLLATSRLASEVADFGLLIAIAAFGAGWLRYFALGTIVVHLASTVGIRLGVRRMRRRARAAVASLYPGSEAS